MYCVISDCSVNNQQCDAAKQCSVLNVSIDSTHLAELGSFSILPLNDAMCNIMWLYNTLYSSIPANL